MGLMNQGQSGGRQRQQWPPIPLNSLSDRMNRIDRIPAPKTQEVDMLMGSLTAGLEQSDIPGRHSN
jgi:hypothetical protein